MKKINRIIALCLIATLAFGICAFAEAPSLDELYEKYMSDLGSIDRVYKYDFVEKRIDEEEEVAAEVKYPQAIQIVTTLGIMDYLKDEDFGEDDTVTFSEFLSILETLSDTIAYSDTDGFNNDTIVTSGAAVNFIVEVLGYHVYEGKYNGNNPRYHIASQLGILKGIDFQAEKPVTRGELACIIAAALEIELIDITSVTKDRVSYQIIEGSSLLHDRFSSVFVEGVVTAVPGMNLFPGTKLDKGKIEINRVEYYAENLDASRLFGHKVFAVVKTEEYKENVISIEKSKKDYTIRVPFSDIIDIDSSKITYDESGKMEKINLSSVKTVTVNGVASTHKEFNEELLNKSGEIIFASAIGAEKPDVAAIRIYQDFVVESVSSFSKKIFFSYGQKLNGKNYISTDTEREEILTIVKDGVTISSADVKSGDVLTVSENTVSGDISVVVSDKTMKGVVQGVDPDNNLVTVSGKDYILSNTYAAAVESSFSVPEIMAGLTAEFSITFDGRIATGKSSGDVRHYALLTKVAQGEGFDESVKVRLFADDGTWNNYPLAKKLTFDGDEKTPKETALNLMKESIDEISYQPVRYSLNSDGEINFLDTARTKNLKLGEVDAELDDSRRITYSGEWEGKFNWKQNGALTGSKYLLATETTLFTIPDDVDDEETYFVTKKAKFGSEQEGALKLYSADEFNMVPLVIQKTAGAALEETAFKYFIVTSVFGKRAEDGDFVTGIKCLDFSGSGNWEMREYTAKKTLPMDDVKVGDLVMYAANSGVIQDYKIRVPYADRGTDLSYNLLSYPAYGLGTITDINPQAKLIKFKTGETEIAFTPLKIGVHEKGSKVGSAVSIGDLQIGDRIFVFGTHKEFNVAVLR